MCSHAELIQAEYNSFNIPNPRFDSVLVLELASVAEIRVPGIQTSETRFDNLGILGSHMPGKLGARKVQEVVFN